MHEAHECRVLRLKKILLKQALFGTKAQNTIDRIRRSMRCRMEVPHLQLSEQTDPDHLHAGEDKYTGDNEQWAMKIHDVLTCNQLQHK